MIGSDVDEDSIVNLVEVDRWVQPPSTNTRIRIVQVNTPSFRFYVPPYVVDSTYVDSACVDSAYVDSAFVDTAHSCSSDFHAACFPVGGAIVRSCVVVVCAKSLLRKSSVIKGWRKSMSSWSWTLWRVFLGA
jgi:hypothetical protein